MPHQRRETLSDLSSSYGKPEVFCLLTKSGSTSISQDSNGWTSLHTRAARNEHLQTVKFLLELGTEVSTQNGNTRAHSMAHLAVGPTGWRGSYYLTSGIHGRYGTPRYPGHDTIGPNIANTCTLADAALSSPGYGEGERVPDGEGVPWSSHWRGNLSSCSHNSRAGRRPTNGDSSSLSQ